MRPIGQYSEAVQILVSRLRGAKTNTRKNLSVSLFKGLLAKEHAGKVKKDIHRLLLDIYPEIQDERYNLCGNCFIVVDNEHNLCEKCGREGIDYYSIYFGDARVPISPPTPPVRPPVHPIENSPQPPAHPVETGPQTARNTSDMSRATRGRWPRQQPIFSDPAKAVLQRKDQDEIYESVSNEAFDLCVSILKEFEGFEFCPGFYPFPANPVTEMTGADGVIVRIMILNSATVRINDKLHFVHPELNGDIVKQNHSLMLKTADKTPVEVYSHTSDGQKRCVRALKYKDRSIIRYWLHEVDGRDIEEGEVIYEVRGEKVVRINKNDYWRALVKMGKRRPKI